MFFYVPRSSHPGFNSDLLNQTRFCRGGTVKHISGKFNADQIAVSIGMIRESLMGCWIGRGGGRKKEAEGLSLEEIKA